MLGEVEEAVLGGSGEEGRVERGGGIRERDERRGCGGGGKGGGAAGGEGEGEGGREAVEEMGEEVGGGGF